MFRGIDQKFWKRKKTTGKNPDKKKNDTLNLNKKLQKNFAICSYRETEKNNNDKRGALWNSKNVDSVWIKNTPAEKKEQGKDWSDRFGWRRLLMKLPRMRKTLTRWAGLEAVS